MQSATEKKDLGRKSEGKLWSEPVGTLLPELTGDYCSILFKKWHWSLFFFFLISIPFSFTIYFFFVVVIISVFIFCFSFMKMSWKNTRPSKPISSRFGIFLHLQEPNETIRE